MSPHAPDDVGAGYIVTNACDSPPSSASYSTPYTLRSTPRIVEVTEETEEDEMETGD